MATTENGIYYPNDGTKPADILTDMKEMAESIDAAVGEEKTDIKKLQTDITDLQKSQAEQDEEIQVLKNALPSETQENEYINLKGTIPTKFKEFKLSGNSKQETREGYNLLNVPETLEISIFKEIEVNLQANKNYTFKFDNALAGADNNQSLITFRNTSDVISRTIDTSTTKKITVQPEQEVTNIRIYASTNYTSSTGKTKTFEKLMIYEGTEDKIYEEYGAMPSPEFISKIENVEGSVNEFDVSQVPTALQCTKKGDIENGYWYQGNQSDSQIYASSRGWLVLPFNFDANKNYVLSFKIKMITLGNSAYVRVQTHNNFTALQIVPITDEFQKVEVPINIEQADNVLIALNSNEVQITDIKIEQGTEATEYSPYGYGNANVTVCNKNLVGGQWTTGLYDVNGNLGNTNGVYKCFRKFLKAGTYSYSYNANIVIARYVNLIKKENLTLSASSFTLDKDSEISLGFRKADSSTWDLGENLADIEFQLEKGSVATDYVEHQEQNVLFPLAQEQKLHLGDYLASDGIHHVRKQIELDGTDFSLYSNQVAGRTIYMISAFSNNNNFKTYDSSILCNILKQGTSSNGNNYLNNNGYSGSLYVSIENSILGITDESTNEEKLQAFQNLIAETGFVYEGELAEEEIEPYTEEQQEAYNQLINLKAYEEETNVYSTNEVSPIFKVTAVKDINSVITELNTVLLERS